MSRRLLLLATLTLAALAAPGCAHKTEPQFASSATEPAYAEHYAAELQTATVGFGERRDDAKKAYDLFGSYPDQLHDVKQPGWAVVGDVVRRADEGGHGRAFAKEVRQTENVRAFFDTEKDDINRRVGGAVTFVAKKKGCDAEVGGAVGPALKDAVDKQIDKRMHEANGAHFLLERHRTELGKENSATLEKQADDISRASYIVHIELAERRERIVRMLDEASQVKKTASEFIESERAYQAEAKLTAAEKKASDDRVAAVQKGTAGVDDAVAQAKQVVPKLEDEIEKARHEYAEALEALKKKIEAMRKAAPAK